MNNEREQMKIVIVGHVDHGKSTLVGRIFYDTDSLPEGKFEQIQAQCKRRGMQFEWSFLMDALQAERDQEITIDTTQIWFKTKKRDYVIIDAPGHKEFLKNMISGAAMSEAALLVIDAREGVQEQSKRHGYLLRLLGVEQIAVAVNKMDLVDYSEERFRAIEAEYRSYLASIGVTPRFIIPIAAREGDLILSSSKNMPWYKGVSVIEALDQFNKRLPLTDLPLRLPIQDVYRFDEHQRIFAGRLESGALRVGDELIFSPSNKRSRIASIESWGRENQLTEAEAGMSVGITLTEQIFVERGEIISHNNNAPMLSNLFRARIFWLSHAPLSLQKRYTLKLTTSSYKVTIKTIEKVIDTDALASHQADKVERNNVAEIIIHVRGLAALDDFQKNPILGRFMLMDGYEVSGGGIIDTEGFSDQRTTNLSTSCDFAASTVSDQERALSNGHTGGILWLTGLPGSGKTTLAHSLEKTLFQRGLQVYVLNEQRLRSGLASELGHSAADDVTLLRQAAYVAGMLARAGLIVIADFISPLAVERRMARSIYPQAFASVYVSTAAEVCKARSGEKENFTAIAENYEAPENADLVIPTNLSADEALKLSLSFVYEQWIDPLNSSEIGGEI
jgi:bifunctional enzyme CysN/CysC